MENKHEKLEHRFLHRIQICNLHEISNQLKSVSSVYEGNNFKPRLTKQLLNMFMLTRRKPC